MEILQIIINLISSLMLIGLAIWNVFLRHKNKELQKEIDSFPIGYNVKQEDGTYKTVFFKTKKANIILNSMKDNWNQGFIECNNNPDTQKAADDYNQDKEDK